MQTAVASAQALKEWAVTVQALGDGEQIVLVRKGGIREEAREFRVEEQAFLLYPTYEHQRPDLLQPPYRARLDAVLAAQPAPGTVRLAYWAEVTDTLRDAGPGRPGRAGAAVHLDHELRRGAPALAPEEAALDPPGARVSAGRRPDATGAAGLRGLQVLAHPRAGDSAGRQAAGARRRDLRGSPRGGAGGARPRVGARLTPLIRWHALCPRTPIRPTAAEACHRPLRAA